MAKFLFLYRANADQGMTAPSPEAMQEHMKHWYAWFEACGPAIVDGGDGLCPTGRVLSAAGTVGEGPHIEAKEMIGGYSILQAADYAAAVELARGCPTLAHGGRIEIRELAGYE